MNTVELLYTSGIEAVDKVLRGVVGLFELVFPDRVRGYYLAGSYTDGSYVPGSDVDLFLIFKGYLREQELERAKYLHRCCSLLCLFDLELPISDEKTLRGANRVALKLNSRLVYGEDIREQIALPSMDTYIRQVVGVAARFMTMKLRGSDTVSLPLDYPEPYGAFFGYDRVQSAPDGTLIRGTKWLVVSASWIATALIASQAKRYVPGKSHCARLYRASINDEWTEFVETVYDVCKLQWAYHIPHTQAEQQHLREMCKRMLAFENHFLASCWDYLPMMWRGTATVADVSDLR